MNDLHDGAQPDGPNPVVFHELGGHQQQGGAQALAAAFAQILADLGDDTDAGDRVAAELLLDGCQIVSQQFENSFVFTVAEMFKRSSWCSSVVKLKVSGNW